MGSNNFNKWFRGDRQKISVRKQQQNNCFVLQLPSQAKDVHDYATWVMHRVGNGYMPDWELPDWAMAWMWFHYDITPPRLPSDELFGLGRDVAELRKNCGRTRGKLPPEVPGLDLERGWQVEGVWSIRAKLMRGYEAAAKRAAEEAAAAAQRAAEEEEAAAA